MGGVRVGGMGYEGTTGPLYPWKDGLLVGGRWLGTAHCFWLKDQGCQVDDVRLQEPSPALAPG